MCTSVLALILLFSDISYAYKLPQRQPFYMAPLKSRDKEGIFSNIANIFRRNPAQKSVTKSTEPVISTDIAIVGCGLSGLSCAIELIKSGVKNILILEASDGPGGRIRTDCVDGFLLDRGFQVFIDTYPEAKLLFDYDVLDLKPFIPGAIVRYDGAFHTVSDPFRRPQDLIASVVSPIGTLVDKVLVGIFSIFIRVKSLPDILGEKDTATSSYLRNVLNLSPSMVNRFFKPFYQGIFLSSLDLQSSKMFEFVFKMFTEGSANLPRLGMGSIATSLAAQLPSDSLRYNTRVAKLTVGAATGPPSSLLADTATGPLRIEAQRVVLATDAPSGRGLLGGLEGPTPSANNVSSGDSRFSVPEARSSTCLYYGFAGSPPVEDPVLILNGDSDVDAVGASTVVNNVCFPSQVSPAYAPEGQSLASVTVVGLAAGVSDGELDAAVRAQLGDWWGEDIVKAWRLLRIYRIPYAQPAQSPLPYAGATPSSPSSSQKSRLADRLYVCGDHIGSATVNGAIESGRWAARAILEDMK